MHLATLWHWPPLAIFHSSILTPPRQDERPPQPHVEEGRTAVDFEDTTPAFISVPETRWHARPPVRVQPPTS